MLIGCQFLVFVLLELRTFFWVHLGIFRKVPKIWQALTFIRTVVTNPWDHPCTSKSSKPRATARVDMVIQMRGTRVAFATCFAQSEARLGERRPARSCPHFSSILCLRQARCKENSPYQLNRPYFTVDTTCPTSSIRKCVFKIMRLAANKETARFATWENGFRSGENGCILWVPNDIEAVYHFLRLSNKVLKPDTKLSRCQLVLKRVPDCIEPVTGSMRSAIAGLGTPSPGQIQDSNMLGAT